MADGAEVRETMGTTMRLVRPRALVLATAPPSREGSVARRDAWRLLTLAAQTHEIHLIARIDGPMHYDHWRQLAAATRRVMLAPRRGLFAPDRAVRDMVNTWASDAEFDAVICGDESLWRASASVSARVRFNASRHDAHLLASLLAPPRPRITMPTMDAPTSLRRAA